MAHELHAVQSATCSCDASAAWKTLGRIQWWKSFDKHVGVRFDHMTTHIDGKTFKEFRAVCAATRR